jgi:hypothetical protein
MTYYLEKTKRAIHKLKVVKLKKRRPTNKVEVV